MSTYALHFGVVPEVEAATPTIDGHEDPSVEHDFDSQGFEALVAGSWACWGTADQEAAGDNLLHVVTVIEADTHTEITDLAGRAGEALAARLPRGSRLLDYGVVSNPVAWSEEQLTFLRDAVELYAPVGTAPG